MYLNYLIALTCILILLAGFHRYFKHIKQKMHVIKWKRSLNIPQHHKIFKELYQQVNGFVLSKKARSRQDAFDYVYGEIEFESFIALLSLIGLRPESIFYDLGCGTGKAVLAVTMVYPIKQSIGVELLPELYNGACMQVQKLAKLDSYREQALKIEIIHGDFLEVNLNNATDIFINSSSLFNPTWRTLCLKLESLPKIRTVITTSKPILSDKFQLIKTTRIQVSWGFVEAFIHICKTNIH